MFTAQKKIVKASKAPVTDIEEQVAQALYDLEVTTSVELKEELKGLHISSAKEVDIDPTKKSIIIFVPYKFLSNFHRIQARLIRELEKKFSGKHVVIIGQRRILRKPNKNSHVKRQIRPRSRTLTCVHEAIMEDLVYPTEIVGKRTRVGLDGSKHYRVLLDMKEQQNCEYKLKTFGAIYKKLTGKDTSFEFPILKD